MFSAGATVCWFAKGNQQGKGLVIRQGRGLVNLLTFRRVMHFFFFFLVAKYLAEYLSHRSDIIDEQMNVCMRDKCHWT